MKQLSPTLIIANPTSGRGRGARTLKRIAATLRTSNVEVLIEKTEAQGHAEALTRRHIGNRSNRPRCIVACGGDGTIQEVAHALTELRSEPSDAVPILGLAPAGRCNDFARALGISKDPKDIARVLLGGASKPIDLGRVNGQCFCTILTVGADAEVSEFVDARNLSIKGTLAYLYGAIRVLMKYKALVPRIEGDFGVLEQPVFVASTANTSMYGGGIPIAPRATPYDGLLDLCIIDAVSRRRVLSLLPRVLRGRHGSAPEVRFFRTSRLSIKTEKPMALWADGERIGTTPAEIDVLCNAIRVMVPRD